MRLDDLIAPTGEATFFRRYWTKRPLVIRRNSPSIYAQLPDLAEFEFLTHALTNPRDGWFSTVKVTASPASDEMLTEEGLINLSSVYSAYVDGHSLLLNQVQRRHRRTGALCRSLEETLSQRGVALSRHIGANAYLSPPHSQGFHIHYDPHEVLILQLEGSKHWRLYDWRKGPRPRKAPEAPVPPDVAGPPTREFILTAGDFLYIPRGMLHDAYTTDSRSLHLTLSVETLTMFDLVSEVIANAPALGDDLPCGFLSSPALPRDRARVNRTISTLLNRRTLESARHALAGRLLANIDPLPGRHLGAVERLDGITATTWLQRAPGVFAHVSVTQSEAALHLPGTTLSAGRAMAEVFRYIAERATVRAKDLPLRASLQAKLGLMRELVGKGLFVEAPSLRR